MGTSQDEEKGEPAEGYPAYYGTFQGQANYPQPARPMGAGGQANYPQQVPPSEAPHYSSTDRSVQSQSGHGIRGRVMEGRPLLGGEHFERGEKLPFCNLGFGWFLFILGFFFVIPWYIGAIVFFCVAHDYRERTGLMACSIASLVFLLLGGTTKITGTW